MPGARRRRGRGTLALLLLLLLLVPVAAIRGALAVRLQPGPAPLVIHFLDVGQGDAALIVAPDGENLLIDDGPPEACGRIVGDLESIGVRRIDYHLASHYHPDHIGCAAQVFDRFPLRRAAFDLGGGYRSELFRAYVQAAGELRRVVRGGDELVLGRGTGAPVRVEIATAMAAGLSMSNANSNSVVAVLRFGAFDAVFGGDLSGVTRGGGVDVESAIAPAVGRVEVYKVHHHGSSFSSNAAWLAATSPKVAVLSVGDGNRYAHPGAACLERLHAAGVTTYWTERGAGAAPGSGDSVVGNVRVEVLPGATAFSVKYPTGTDTYSLWADPAAAEPARSLASGEATMARLAGSGSDVGRPDTLNRSRRSSASPSPDRGSRTPHRWRGGRRSAAPR